MHLASLELAQQAATLEKHRAPAIAPRPSLLRSFFMPLTLRAGDKNEETSKTTMYYFVSVSLHACVYIKV